MASDVQVLLGFIVVFLTFINYCKQFFILLILSFVVGMVGVYIDSYFAIPELIHYWMVLVCAMTSIYGLSKSIYLGRKAYKKGKLLMEEVY